VYCVSLSSVKWLSGSPLFSAFGFSGESRVFAFPFFPLFFLNQRQNSGNRVFFQPKLLPHPLFFFGRFLLHGINFLFGAEAYQLFSVLGRLRTRNSLFFLAFGGCFFPRCWTRAFFDYGSYVCFSAFLPPLDVAPGIPEFFPFFCPNVRLWDLLLNSPLLFFPPTTRVSR